MLLAFVSILIGCTAIDYNKAPPADWPHLTPVFRKVSMLEVQAKCGGIPFVWHVFMCMEPDFARGECNLYHYYEPHELAHKSARWIVEHELAHCQGYDHYGSTELRDLWNEWKIGKR